MHGVAGTVIGLCGCGGHAAYGVMVTIVVACEVVVAVMVIVLHVVVVTVVTPHVVSWLQLLCCVVPQEYGEWTEKEGVSRKRKKKTYKQREASTSMVTQCMQPRVAW